MQTRQLEITVGFFMALGLVALFFLAMQVSNLASISSDEGYTITARFDNIGGLKV
ncbi:MAG: outer membrane lipid asymmetry maintenance protein MlaD, partial [Candidatus Thiodiazotropha endolucinida]|nr:outer membrane lipid asymmetry maintenance protein MlaD [Candidatus Thiodiazotropha taylori]MCW4241511.1 outer membrane lipid asymmetry maintenance protein MlaD [Candidatus Thiodiazotropha taylori]